MEINRNFSKAKYKFAIASKDSAEDGVMELKFTDVRCWDINDKVQTNTSKLCRKICFDPLYEFFCI